MAAALESADMSSALLLDSTIRNPQSRMGNGRDVSGVSAERRKL